MPGHVRYESKYAASRRYDSGARSNSANGVEIEKQSVSDSSVQYREKGSAGIILLSSASNDKGNNSGDENVPAVEDDNAEKDDDGGHEDDEEEDAIDEVMDAVPITHQSALFS